MAGWNKDEGFNFTLLQGDDAKRPYVELARAIFGERTEALLQHYPDGSPEIAAASARALGGDLVIIHPTWAWIEAQKQSGRADIFRFRFDRAPLNAAGLVRRARQSRRRRLPCGRTPLCVRQSARIPVAA